MPAPPDDPSRVQVVEVASRRDEGLFLTFPERLYRGSPHWVPPLLVERRAFLDPRKNPFFEHGEVKLFLARDGEGVVRGRIAAVVNHLHLEVHGDGVGFFGLFECESDQGVARRLFDAAAAFLRARGLRVMRGPASLSVHDEIGLLTDGYDSPPAILMPYNPPYYRDLVEAYGFERVMALWAYRAEDRDGTIPDRLTQGVALARRRHGYSVRPIDLRRLDEDLGRIHEVYNEAWRDNWGAVPMTRRELDHVAGLLRWFGDPELCLIAEVGGETAGFSLSLPDLNQVLIKVGGRLLPLGLLRLLWHRRRIDTVRMLAMGVLRKFRYMAIDVCLYHETIRRGLAKGYRQLEMSWVLESNVPMNRVLQKLGARIAKTYQIYDFRL